MRLLDWGGTPVLGEHPDPVAGPDEVLIHVQACGIGLTVLNCMRGDLGSEPGNLPRVPGHEVVGTVVGCGAGVSQSRLGELVTAYFYLHCDRCGPCVRGAQSLCENFSGYVGVDRDGGYAELVALPSRNAIALPGSVDPIEATIVPDAVATPVHVARRAGIQPGQRVAVIAAGGGVGAHMVQVARLYGGRVVALEANEQKLRYLESELGFDVMNSSDFACVRLARAWHDKADVVVDLLGSTASLRWSLDALDTGGRLVTVTTFRDVDTVISSRELVLGEKSMIGSRYCGKGELLEAGALVARGDVQAVIGCRVALDGVEDVHNLLRRGELVGRGALVMAAR